MRVVVDTNILVSALINPNGRAADLYRLWQDGGFDLITSAWQLAEIRRVTRYPRLKDKFKPHEAGRLVNGLKESALFIGEPPAVDMSPDPDDNHLIAAALAGRAHYLVSGDKRDLLTLGKVGAVRLVTVSEFVKRLR